MIYIERLHDLWFSDTRARRYVQASTLLIAFGYGVFNELALKRPENRVTWETLGVVGILTVVFSFLYCIRAHEIAHSMLSITEVVRRHRTFFALGCGSVIVLIVSNLAFDTRSVRADLINLQLKRSIAVGEVPLDPSKAERMATLIQTAAAERLKVDPKVVTTAGQELFRSQAFLQSPTSWPTGLALAYYTTTLDNAKALESEAHSFPLQPCFAPIMLDRIPFPNVVIDRRIENCTQDLDFTEWQHVVFRNVNVVYHGHSAQIADVSFVDCSFNIEDTPGGRSLMQYLLQSSTIQDFKSPPGK